MDVKQHYNPVRLNIGKDSIKMLPQEILNFGKKCLIVAQNDIEPMKIILQKVTAILDSKGIEYDLFSKIRPNPLTIDIDKGIKMIAENNYCAIVAIGGGSVIDTSKILSVSGGSPMDWGSLFANPLMDHCEKRLPLFSIPTTAGTGSHCTQAAIISDEKNIKHSIYNFDFFSTAAFVDYTLTMSLPKSLTASTGFDAFCHLSESYIMGRLSPMMEVMNLDAMKKIVETLPKLVEDNKEEYREIMSIADSCAGICLSNGGAIIPHAFGEAISSTVYRINHGCSLAICYPPFVEYFYEHEKFGDRVKEVVGVLNVENNSVKNGKDARKIVEQFIESIGLKSKLSEYEVTEDETKAIKQFCLSQKRFKPEEICDIVNDICGK